MSSWVKDQPLSAAPLSTSRPAAGLKRNFFPLPLLWLCFVVLLISVLAPTLISGSDIWFHLSNARQLLTSHHFLHEDAYTFTSAGAELLNHEWLSELPYYLGYKTWGLRGLLAVNTLVLCLVFAAMYYLACRRGADCGDAALTTIAAILLGLASSGPRMHNFGYLCLTVLLITLERFQQTGRGLWLIPPVFTVWVNLHGSWVFGFVIMGIYLASGLMKDSQGRIVAEPWKRRQLAKLLAVMFASAAALLVNPYGYKLVWYPFDLLFRQHANMANVVEWQSVNFNTFNGVLALCLIFTLLGIGLVTAARWAVRDVLMAGFALWTGLSHVRFLQFAAIVLIPIVAPKLQICPPYDSAKDNSWRNMFAAAALIVLLVWGYSTEARLQAIVDTDFPRDALHYMQQHNITGRLFHKYDFGGYIEWNAPEIKTFADGRTDIFVYNGVFDDYLKARDVRQPFEIFDKYKVEYVLYPPNTALSYVLDRSSGWRVIYSDSVTKLYQRAQPTGPAVANQPSLPPMVSPPHELSK